MMISKQIKELRGYEHGNGIFHLFFVFVDGTYVEVSQAEVTADLNDFYKVKTQETGKLFEREAP